MKMSEYISKKNKMTKEDIKLAKIIGLLHDYARFEQWTKYKTFSDLDSLDHGDLGVELLFNNNEIKKFSVSKKHYDIVSESIKYHNKYNIKNELSNITKLHSKIIRDSDKLDIYYIISKNQSKVETMEISKNVKETFYKNKLVKRKDVQSICDEVILELSWVFDINFKVSYEYLKKKKYIWKIYKNINNEKYLEYFKYADKYIDEKIERLGVNNVR